MRDFGKVSPKVWHEPKFRSLATMDQLLYLYFLTSPHQNSSGCCRLPSGYACADLNWQPGAYDAAQKSLVDCELVLVDEKTNEVLIVGWFLHNAPQNEKHKTGTVRLIEKIQSERLRSFAHQAFEQAWQQFIDAALQKGLSRGPQRQLPLPTVVGRR